MKSSLPALQPSTLPVEDALFRQVIEQSLIGVMAVEDQKIIYANPRCAEIFGRPLEKLIDCSVDELMPPSYRKGATQPERMAGSDLSLLTPVRGLRADGSIRDLETQTTAFHTGDDRRVSVIRVLDVTERNQRVDKALDQLFAEWRGTFDAVNTPIVMTQPDGSVVRANRAACELGHFREARVIGRKIADLGPSEPWWTADQMVKYISHDRASSSAETVDEEGRTWDINISFYSDEGDQTERCILVMWDITGTVELQESLRRSETMSAMGKIVAGVAHEVRNPLFGISATLDAFAEEMSRPGYQECAAALNGEVKHLTSLMQDLLEYGKPSALHIEEGSLHDIIEEVRHHHASSEIKIDNAVPSALPKLLMDRSRMRQVFENLVENAEQHTPSHSTVVIAGSVVTHSGRRWLECRVEDNGPGFNPEDLDHVFDPFFTRREGGTGLGLSIVQRIVHDHSGKVFAGNSPERGAVIRILLPLAENQG